MMGGFRLTRGDNRVNITSAWRVTWIEGDQGVVTGETKYEIVIGCDEEGW